MDLIQRYISDTTFLFFKYFLSWTDKYAVSFFSKKKDVSFVSVL